MYTHSAGSRNHGYGKCQPCAWYWKPKSCRNDQEFGGSLGGERHSGLLEVRHRRCAMAGVSFSRPSLG